MKQLLRIVLCMIFVSMTGFWMTSEACTNFLVTKGASVDGSVMISYSADSHTLYGELYHWAAASYPEGALLDVYEWDTGKYLGKIKQARQTYNVIGNMNEHQVGIGETTYGGREELGSQTGAIMDYGSMMYIALQRSKTAREAIKVMTSLVAEYGYASSGESISVSDPDEAWIFEIIGKGEGQKGAVWVALRIPDGYVCAHANHARITTFPLANGKTSITFSQIDKIFDPAVECVYSDDVITFARTMKYFDGKDQEFSFSDTYAPLDFSAARFCEVRVWAFFRSVRSGMDKYLDYASGHNLKNRMPLWIKPDRKLSVTDMMDFMRDHLEGTPLDMTQDMGAGPYKNPYRWRPLTFMVDGKVYCNERATSSQQCGFVFVAQSRSWLPDPIGGIHWFGVDDPASTVFVPMYCSITEAPHAYAAGNGAMMEFTFNSAFWVFNMVSNFAYTRYSDMHPEIREAQTGLENTFVEKVRETDQKALALYNIDPKAAVEFLTGFSAEQGALTLKTWQQLWAYLFTRYMDGNIKTSLPVPDGYNYYNPKVEQPGYGEEWYRKIVEETGEHFLVPGVPSH